MSEKLDGFRCFWDGGITRGMAKDNVPWANLDKDDRYIDIQLATGLWTRYGNVIHAPDWFLDDMPQFMLDGELYMGRGMFQTCRSIASKLPENRSNHEWKGIQYNVFDIPSPEEVFKPREIKGTQFTKTIGPDSSEFARSRLRVIPRARAFRNILLYLKKNLIQTDRVRVHEQTQLPFSTEKALEVIYRHLEEIVDLKGEGVMLRRPDSIWIPERSHELTKVKKFEDSEAAVVGYVTGRRTDKGSKLLGLMGALVVEWNGKIFELAGFDDADRVLEWKDNPLYVPITELRTFEGIPPKDLTVEQSAFKWAMANPSPPNGPGTRVPPEIHNPKFPRGSMVTFKYTETSDDGIPKVASYWRTHS